MQQAIQKRKFSQYEIFIITILTILQFTIILDFMVLSPLGAILMPALKIKPSQFGMVVSAYAISAGISGLLAAGFADRFDRKKLLLFFYAGFILGTLLCGLVGNYQLLLMARIVTGIFGGVIGSIAFSIVTDLFEMQVRGRVMGFLQMAFASSQVLGIPLGLYLANKWDWHMPFLMIVGVSIIVGILIVLYMKPINMHLQLKTQRNAFEHFGSMFVNSNYVKAFLATTLLATGGFMLMPFSSAFSVNNLGINMDNLPLLYFVTGVFSMIAGPIIGKLSDTIGKYKVFVAGSLLSILIVLFYCNLGVTPFWVVLLISIFMFIGVSSRIISSSALMTAVPVAADRGAFMAINSSGQYISGGIATFVAGLIVVQNADQSLSHYDILGYIVTGTMLLSMAMMYTIHRYVTCKAEQDLQKAA
jgi:predicted MFS family arabinose efflux permease